MSVVSLTAQASYVRLSDHKIVRTIEVGDDFHIDLDWTGRPVGIETLGGGDWRDAIVTLLMAGEVRLVHGIKPDGESAGPGRITRR